MKTYLKTNFTLVLQGLLIASLSISAPDSLARQSYGGSGETGVKGRNGDAGTVGRDLEIEARGSQTTFMISGGDGSHGDYGGDGGHAYDCDQPSRTSYDLKGASGGDGGNGGDGGSGGRGGDIVVFYNDIADLSRLSVISAGGAGGDGGPGGRGGQACNCSRESWSVRTCEDKKNDDGSTRNECRNKSYSCNDGRDGQRGSRGQRGARGADGTLYIVKGGQNWQRDQLSESVSLSDAVGSRFTLIENIFAPKDGAGRLLASNSIVNREYFEYESTEYARFALNWKSPRDYSAFSNVILELNKKGPEVVHKLDGVLLEYQSQGIEDKVLTINNIVLSEEASSTEFSAEIDGPNTKLVVTDNSNAGDILDDRLELEFFTKRLIGWKKRLSRELAADEWKKDGDKFIITLSDLGMKKKFIKKNRKVKVKLSIKRRLGDDSITVQHNENLKLSLAKKS